MSSAVPSLPDGPNDEDSSPKHVEDIGEAHEFSCFRDCPDTMVLGKLISGEEISPYCPIVVEHNTSKGDALAIKFPAEEWELEMVKYAWEHNITVPKPHYLCAVLEKEHEDYPELEYCEQYRSIRPGHAMVTEKVPGKTLLEVWDDLSQAEKSSIKDQLRAQIAQMRTCTQDTIGRLSSIPLYQLYHFRFIEYCGPFSTEEDYDNWRLKRARFSKSDNRKFKALLSRRRSESSGKFVFTHGNLSPKNIMVQGSTITGILGWADSGFFPEETEYAVAMAQFDEKMEWWASVLADVLEPCPWEIVRLTRLVRMRRYNRCKVGYMPVWVFIPAVCFYLIAYPVCGLYDLSRGMLAERAKRKKSKEESKKPKD